MPKRCLIDGRPLTGNQTKYCSKECARAAKNRITVERNKILRDVYEDVDRGCYTSMDMSS